jgi:hypothetical protein
MANLFSKAMNLTFLKSQQLSMSSWESPKPEYGNEEASPGPRDLFSHGSPIMPVKYCMHSDTTCHLSQSTALEQVVSLA